MSQSMSSVTDNDLDLDASRSRIDRAEADYRGAMSLGGRGSSEALFAYRQWMNLKRLHRDGLAARERLHR